MNYTEMLEFYEIALKECVSTGMSRAAAKTCAKDKVYSAYPDMVSNGAPSIYNKDASLFWSKASHISEKIFGRSKRSKKFQMELPSVASENFSKTMRAAAETGFIPFGEYLAPFIKGKHTQIQSYVSMLRSEGYECKRNSHGWVVTKIETDAQRIAREKDERARAEAERIAVQRKEIEAQIESAKARATAEIEELFKKLAEAK